MILEPYSKNKKILGGSHCGGGKKYKRCHGA
jgi:uncharacterized protein YchJ